MISVCPKPLIVLDKVEVIYINGHINPKLLINPPEPLLKSNASISLPYLANMPRHKIPNIELKYMAFSVAYLIFELLLLLSASDTVGSNNNDMELTIALGNIMSGRTSPRSIPYILKDSDDVYPYIISVLGIRILCILCKMLNINLFRVRGRDSVNISFEIDLIFLQKKLYLKNLQKGFFILKIQYKAEDISNPIVHSE